MLMTRQTNAVLWVAVLAALVARHSAHSAGSSPRPQAKPAAPAAPAVAKGGARAPNPATAVVAARLAEVLSKSPTALESLHQDGMVELVLRAGDLASAERLLDTAKPGAVQNRTIGRLCGLLPGGPQGARGRALLAKH